MSEVRRASRFLLVALAIIAAVSFVLLKPILSGLTFGLVLGFLAQKPYARLAKRVRYPRALAVAIIIVFCIAIDIPLLILGWELLHEIEGIAATARDPALADGLARALTHVGIRDAEARAIVGQLGADASAWLSGATIPTLQFVGATLMNTGVFLFVLYYTLVSGPQLVEWLRNALPLPQGRRGAMIDAIARRCENLFLGSFLVALCMGILNGILWWILGFPDPVFWGAVLTILSLIPAIGTGIVIFPAGAYAILVGRVWQGGTLLVWTLAISPFVANAIRATFVGKTQGVHPALVLVGTVGGLGIFGPAGFLLGPLVLSMIDPVLDEWQRLGDHGGDGGGDGAPPPPLPSPPPPSAS